MDVSCTGHYGQSMKNKPPCSWSKVPRGSLEETVSLHYLPGVLGTYSLLSLWGSGASSFSDHLPRPPHPHGSLLKPGSNRPSSKKSHWLPRARLVAASTSHSTPPPCPTIICLHNWATYFSRTEAVPPYRKWMLNKWGSVELARPLTAWAEFFMGYSNVYICVTGTILSLLDRSCLSPLIYVLVSRAAIWAAEEK